MSTLKVTVTTKTMPHTSEFFAVVKAVEHFYYALLFGTGPAYAGSDEPWVSWIDQGFSAAIRQAPPATSEADELTTSVRSDGKIIDITASSSNSEVLDRLAAVLSAVDAHRVATAGSNGKGGPISGAVSEQLLTPVSDALRSSNADARTTAKIQEVLDQGVRALTYRDITAVEINTAVAAG